MWIFGSSPAAQTAAPNDRRPPGRTPPDHPAPADTPWRRAVPSGTATPRDQLPGPLDRFLLEIIAKRPVPQHLEERVVIGVEPHVLEVVVLPARPDALLRVRRPRVQPRLRPAPPVHIRVPLPQKDRHKLVHPRVREQQVRRVRHQARRRHERVLLRPEKIEEERYDSGIFFRVGLEGKPWPKDGWQVNLRHDAMGGLVRGYTGIEPAPTARIPVNRWIRIRLEVRGARAVLTIDDEEGWVYEKLDRDRGYLGIQAEDRAFDFRNLRIQELPRG
jgi:hypothetical protein